MAIDHRIGTKVQKQLRREDAPASRIDPYPYIAVVKNNFDPTRSGRLQVWVPDLGGNPDDSKNWRTVGYASPFMGYTPQKFKDTDLPSAANKFTEVPHTYGMWMVPPDLGVEVLVVFVAGDPTRGYWLACVNSHLSHHMVPGIASSTNVEDSSMDAYSKELVKNGVAVPVVEFNEYDPAKITSNYINNKKPLHKPQFDILKKQGLEQDPIRGTTTSSSQRETPSHVFGISTPGRPIDDDYIGKLNKQGQDYYRITTRKGGHSFVMDDGAVTGEDQLVRIKTAGGHQILMHDTANTLYIANADGTAWFEMTADGKIKMYAASGFCVRSEGSINLHSDANININAGGSIKMKAENKIQAQASTETTLLTRDLKVTTTEHTEFKTGILFAVDCSNVISLQAVKAINSASPRIADNSGGTESLKAVPLLPVNKFPDAGRAGAGSPWIVVPGALETIVTCAPTHEPHVRTSLVPGGNATADKDSAPTPKLSEGKPIGTPPSTSSGTPPTLPKTKELRTQPAPLGKIGNLSGNQLRAYLAGLASKESSSPTPADKVCTATTTKKDGTIVYGSTYGQKLQNGKAGYEAVNQCGFLGKYQMGAEALAEAKFVKKGTTLATLSDNNNWLIGNYESFIAPYKEGELHPQEIAIQKYTESNYRILAQRGVITTESTPGEVGGYLQAAHLKGAGTIANAIDKDGTLNSLGPDSNGTSAAYYYNVGRQSVEVVAAEYDKLDAAPSTVASR